MILISGYGWTTTTWNTDPINPGQHIYVIKKRMTYLFFPRQVEQQVRLDERFAGGMKERHVLVFESREITCLDLLESLEAKRSEMVRFAPRARIHTLSLGGRFHRLETR